MLGELFLELEKELKRKIDDRACRFCQALGDLSDRRSQRWWLLDSVAKKLGVPWDDAEAAAKEAAAKGGLTIEAGHSVRLTDGGQRLGTKS